MYQANITMVMKTKINKMSRKMLTRRDFKVKLEQLKTAEESQRPTVCAELCRMFRMMEIDCSPSMDDAYYEKLISNSRFYRFEDIEEKILKMMFDNFTDYPSPQKYMLRIVNRLSSPEDGWQDDTLRLRILRQFIKYGNCMTYTTDDKKKIRIYNGEGYLKKYARAKSGKAIKTNEDICSNIDDDVFGVLENASSEQLAADGTYGIIKAADDLAKGIFKPGGATKKALYMFAMVFNMTYTIVSDKKMANEKIIDYESDIEKNLFEDYYTNNLIRFITSAYDKYNGKLNAVETDPSGQGINYKNFAEMVYIYFISKDCEPQEKIEQSDRMIKRLTASSAKQMSEKSGTGYYKSLFTDDILMMPEKEFEEFISRNYDCNVELTGISRKGEVYHTKKGELQLQNEQNNAFRCYNRLRAEIKEAIGNKNDDKDLFKKHCNYGLWFTDILDIDVEPEEAADDVNNVTEAVDEEAAKAIKAEAKARRANELMKKRKEARFDRIAEITGCERRRKTGAFIRLLGNINKCLKHDKLEITKAENMCRTALITAYYYWYNHVNVKNETTKNFADVMADYTDSAKGLDSYLNEAGYPLISEKNIFDIAVIFSSYAYLVK